MCGSIQWCKLPNTCRRLIKLSYVVESKKEGKTRHIGFRDKVCWTNNNNVANTIVMYMRYIHTGGADHLWDIWFRIESSQEGLQAQSSSCCGVDVLRCMHAWWYTYLMIYIPFFRYNLITNHLFMHCRIADAILLCKDVEFIHIYSPPDRYTN